MSTDPIKDKNKNNFNSKAFKYALSMVESSGGKFLTNPNSSASGKYHFLWKYLATEPSLKGISQREFISSPELQEDIMNKAINGKLKNYPNYSNYSESLKARYNSNLPKETIAALTHFMGAGGVKSYLKNKKYNVPGKVNLSAKGYEDKFGKYFQEYKSREIKNENIPSNEYIGPRSNANDFIKKTAEKANLKRIDNTRNRFNQIPGLITPDNMRGVSSQNSQNQSLEGLITPNNFKNGGQMYNNTGDARDLVTMFEAGGTHEQNPLGGIPQGVGSNGKPNLVEEGETKWNDYIFSNSLGFGGKIDSGVSSNNVYKEGGKLDDCECGCPGKPPCPDKKKNNTSKDPISLAWGKINDDKNNYIKSLPEYKELILKKSNYTREQYLEDFNKNIENIKNHRTSDKNYKGAVASGSMNCINGVTCSLQENTGLFQDKTFQGNLSFDDESQQLGFIDLKKEDYNKNGVLDLQEGDLMRFQMSPGMYSRFHENSPTKPAPGQTFTSHTAIYGGIQKDGPNKGKHIYINNGGDRSFKTQYLTKEEMIEKLGPSFKHVGVNLTRYNPKEAIKNIEKRNKQNKILSGQNEHSNKYDNSSLNLNIKDFESLGENKLKNYNTSSDKESIQKIRKISNIFSENYNILGRISNVDPSVLEKMIHSQIGIAGQESEYGNSKKFYAKALVPDSNTNSLKSTWNDIESGWDSIMSNRKLDWKDEMWKDDQVKKKYKNDRILFNEEVNKSQSSGLGSSKEVSKGVFQQKELSKRGRALGLNLDVSTHGPLASLALQIDNYHKLKKVHSNLSEEELIDLSILAHNQPSKAFNKIFVDYYLKKNDIDYVNKVKKYRNRFVKGYKNKKSYIQKQMDSESNYRFNQRYPDRMKKMEEFSRLMRSKKK